MNYKIHDLSFGRNSGNALKGSKKYHLSRLLLACVVASLIFGCSITQNYQRPQVDIPQHWCLDYQEAADLANTTWWEQFRDPILNELITIALNENKDLRIAAARVEEFSGKLQVVQSGFYPQINYGGSASRDNQSLERAVPQLVRGDDRTNTIYQTVMNAGWELDIWGRLRRETEAARADLLSAEEVRQAVILTLVSDMAVGYISLLSMDKMLLTARQTLSSREEFLRLFERKSEGGQVSGLELAQVRSAYEQVAEYIPTLELQIALQENALSVLLGKNPGIINRGRTLDKLFIPKVPKGIPSDLLERRPDIRQSEQDLIAANARIGVARTQYFPTISLTGLFGYASASLSQLVQSSANLWHVGAEAIGPIFTGGRIKGEIRQTEARQQQVLNKYLSTIQTALKEVNDSLVTIQKLRELLEIKARHVSALQDNVNFARSRYDAKYTSYLEVVDAERNLFFAELSYIQTQRDVFAAMVNIYKAMGGGWVTEANKLIAPSTQKNEPVGAGVISEERKTQNISGNHSPMPGERDKEDSEADKTLIHSDLQESPLAP